MSFQVDYFNGQSSKTHQATLNATNYNWGITYINDLGNTEEINWEVDKIKKSEVYTKGLIAFSYGDSFPFQKIESTDERFIAYINNSDYKNLNNKLDVWLHKSVKKSTILLLTTIVGIAIGIYFYVIPTVAVHFAANLSKQNVISFGSYVFTNLSKTLDIDKERSKKLQEFVDEMHIATEFPLRLHVANSEDMNAFAISGGKIVVFSSLLEKIENEHQLAALIGHEVSHVKNRHVLKNVARNLSGALFISILFGDVSGITTIIANNAHLFSQLSYTRGLEKEADIFGMEIMKKNNLDLHGMPELFQILKNESSIDVPTYLNNHPMLKDRIEYTQKIADEQDFSSKNTILKEKWDALKNTFPVQKEGKEIENENNELNE